MSVQLGERGLKSFPHLPQGIGNAEEWCQLQPKTYPRKA